MTSEHGNPWFRRFFHQGLLTFTVTLALSPLSEADKDFFITESYFFPYLCSVVFGIESHEFDDWVSTCTILNKRWVAVSVDNVNQPKPALTWPYFYHLLDGIRVHAGSVFGVPEKLNKTLMHKLKHHQVKSVSVLWVPIDAAFVFDDKKKPRFQQYSPLMLQDKNLAPNMTQDITFNVIGEAEWGVGYLEIDFTDPFEWNVQILPAPLFDNDPSRLATAVRRRVDEMEKQPLAQTSCSVGAWDHESQKLLFYQVIHVPFNDCQAEYCRYDPKGCMRFPRYELHVCFKSIVYGDLCPEDRGAAVYCSNFNRSILGILTTAPNCGHQNLPNVYTLVHHVAEAFRSLNQRIERITDLSTYDPPTRI